MDRSPPATSLGRMTDTESLPPRTSGPRGRLTHLDAMRGFALLGIVVVNSTLFAFPERFAAATTTPDPVSMVIAGLFEAKFYVLFSFLFGASAVLLRDSVVRRGRRFAPAWWRRCAGLAVLGLAHAFLLFPGDILFTYAIFGAVLLAALTMSPRARVALAAGVLAVVAVGFLALAGLLALLGPSATPAGGTDVAGLTAMLAGTPSDVVSAFASLVPSVLGSVVLLQGPLAFAMFLLGSAAVESGRLDAAALTTRVLRRTQVLGFAIGLPGAVLAAVTSMLGDAAQIAAFALTIITAPALTAAYAATLVRALRGRAGPAVARVFEPAGRMSLTNYLGQSLLLALVFTGYGLGLVGQLSSLQVLAVALGIFAVQSAVSGWWLSRHRQGPLEVVLRGVTNAGHGGAPSATGPRPSAGS